MEIAVDKLPCTFIDAIDCCDELLFPEIYQYLKIGTTLLITVVSVELSFSTFKVVFEEFYRGKSTR